MNKKVTPVDLAIAKNLRDYRNAGTAGVPLTKAKLAKVLGIKYQSYSDMENGLVSFRVSTLMTLAEFYDTDIEHFLI
jgi:DNA-binding XRE family transcriptional regulator